MENLTPNTAISQSLTDLVDFPCSDLWRDQYAAQGMTYPSGRYTRCRRADHRRSMVEAEPDAHAAATELLEVLRQFILELRASRMQFNRPDQESTPAYIDSVPVLFHEGE